MKTLNSILVCLVFKIEYLIDLLYAASECQLECGYSFFQIFNTFCFSHIFYSFHQIHLSFNSTVQCFLFCRLFRLNVI